MKVAAAHAIASLAKEDVPDEVVAAMGGERPHYGKDYISINIRSKINKCNTLAVAKAAID